MGWPNCTPPSLETLHTNLHENEHESRSQTKASQISLFSKRRWGRITKHQLAHEGLCDGPKTRACLLDGRGWWPLYHLTPPSFFLLLVSGIWQNWWLVHRLLLFGYSGVRESPALKRWEELSWKSSYSKRHCVELLSDWCRQVKSQVKDKSHSVFTKSYHCTSGGVCKFSL